MDTESSLTPELADDATGMAALRNENERLRQAIQAAGVTAWDFRPDRDEVTTWVLDPTLATLGSKRVTSLGACADTIVPEDRALALRQLQDAVASGEPLESEYRIVLPDGGTRWFMTRARWQAATPDGIRRLAGITVDITERKRAQQTNTLLIAELQHRVRNIIAAIRSIARRSAETGTTIADYVAHLEDRINSLARTQVVLTRAPGDGIELGSLIADELSACAIRPGQVRIDGPTVCLQPRTAETLGLAIHELAINAVKYGALDNPGGTIDVTWRVVGETPDSKRLVLEWREAGVRMIDMTPHHIGFGRRMIERHLPEELGARATLDFAPGGIRCVIDMSASESNLVAPDAPSPRRDHPRLGASG